MDETLDGASGVADEATEPAEGTALLLLAAGLTGLLILRGRVALGDSILLLGSRIFLLSRGVASSGLVGIRSSRGLGVLLVRIGLLILGGRIITGNSWSS